MNKLPGKGEYSYAKVMSRGETTIALKPLVAQAIDKQAKMLAHEIKRTQKELARFEQRYVI